MNIFEKELEILKDSSTYLLYSDNRISIIEKMRFFSSLLLNCDEKNLDTNMDYYYYEDIKIDDVRNLIVNSVESSYTKGNKVYVINNIEKTRKEALNALLKILEEPPKNVYFLLLTKSLDILDTIKSRSKIINLNLEIDVDLVKKNKEIYEFLEYDFNLLKEYLELNNFEFNNINDIEDTVNNISNYFEDNKLENKLNYENAILYLLEKLKYSKEEEMLIIKDKILEILSNSKDNKDIREKMEIFLNSCINKLKNKSIDKVEKLIEYKLAIRSNVNPKLIFLLFFQTIFKL